MPITTRTLRTRHAEISIADSGGSGFPLLLIHGSGSAKEAFAPQFESLERFRLIALDLPGHGQSGNAGDPATAYNVHGFAETIAELIASLRIDRMAVYGWSLGGHIAIELLSFHPAVAGLMLTGTPPVAAGSLGMLRAFHTKWDLLLASKEHFSERDALRFFALCFNGHGDPGLLEAIRRSDGRVRSTAVKSMMRGDGADQKRTVEQARVPIAMVNGEHEPFARLGYVAGLDYANLWEGRCHVIEGSGHAPFRDRPEVFNALLSRFVDDVAAHQVAEPATLARSA